MSERRFFVDPADAGGDRLTLRADEAHHARRVIRLEAGAAVLCFDGAGRAWRGRIAGYERDTALVDVVEALAPEPEPAPRITLAQGLVKGDRMDLIVQKAAELGVARIVPVACDRSDVRLEAERVGRRSERWRRIVVEAAKQCERARVPEVAAPAPLEAVLASTDGALVAFVERDGLPARGRLEALRAEPSIAVFVGPEGGWSERERALFVEHGVERLSLGPLVLRAETAAIAGLAVVSYACAPDESLPGSIPLA